MDRTDTRGAKLPDGRADPAFGARARGRVPEAAFPVNGAGLLSPSKGFREASEDDYATRNFRPKKKRPSPKKNEASRSRVDPRRGKSCVA